MLKINIRQEAHLDENEFFCELIGMHGFQVALTMLGNALFNKDIPSTRIKLQEHRKNFAEYMHKTYGDERFLKMLELKNNNYEDEPWGI